LQGLVSNDVESVSAENSIYAALLTPQGKFLYDFFIVQGDENTLLLDCEWRHLKEILMKLKIYKLRSEVNLRDASDDHKIFVGFGEKILELLDLPKRPGATRSYRDGHVMVDPRHELMGVRIILPSGSVVSQPSLKRGSLESYQRMRIGLGIPDATYDLEQNKTILLEAGFDELNGISWDKGCYMGQELTARTKYRGLIKKRLIPCKIVGPAILPGTPITFDERNVGEIRSVAGDLAMALLKIASVKDSNAREETFTANESSIIPIRPNWMKF
jgi:folate-binding protein YgfZ